MNLFARVSLFPYTDIVRSIERSLDADDEERETIISDILEYFRHERISSDVRNDLRWHYWHGLAQVDLGRMKGADFRFRMNGLLNFFEAKQVEISRAPHEAGRAVFVEELRQANADQP